MSKFWTKENTEVAVDMYADGSTPQEIMDKVGAVSPRAVIGKLVAENVYIKPEKPARKTPVDEGPTKAQVLAELKTNGFDTSGFEGATKPALKRLLEAV